MIKSISKPVGLVQIPEHHGEIKMLPFNLANLAEIPEKFLCAVACMISFLPIKNGIAFLTVDGKKLETGKTHRRGGKHIDGNYLFNNWGSTGGWTAPSGPTPSDWKTGGDGKSLTAEQHKLSYESETGGMLIVSNYANSKGWNGIFDGYPGVGGDCSHIKTERKGFILQPNVIYYGNSQFVHESLPAELPVHRTLIRITLPSDYPLICKS